MSENFSAYVRDHVIRMRATPKVKIGKMRARDYRAYRRELRRLWDGLPREMRHQARGQG